LVRAMRAADGTLTATRIEVASGDSTAASSATASINSTPRPSTTPQATQDGGDDDDDDDDNSGPSASNTPRPSETREPTETDQPDDDEIKLEGILESMNGGIWVVAGQSVSVTGATDIRDSVQVGDRVEVRAVRQADGTLVAIRVEKD